MFWIILVCTVGLAISIGRYYYLKNKQKNTVAAEVACIAWSIGLLMWLLICIIAA